MQGRIWASHSLSDPDRLASGNALCSRNRRVKVHLRLPDSVGLRALEVGERIMTQKVTSVDDGSIFTKNPSSPRIDMPDPNTLQRGPSERSADLIDVVDDGLSIRSYAGVVGHALRRAAVEVLRPDGDADDALFHHVRPEGRCLLEGDDLVVDDCLTGRCPDAEEEVRLRVEGCFDGLCVKLGISTQIPVLSVCLPIGALVEPHCMLVYSLADVKPGAPTSPFARLNLVKKF